VAVKLDQFRVASEATPLSPWPARQLWFTLKRKRRRRKRGIRRAEALG
jgi:hypothetical protein